MYRASGPTDAALAEAARGWFSIERTDRGLVLAWRWFGRRRLFYWGVYTLFVAGSAALFYHFALFAVLFGIMLAVGVFVLSALILNRTTIEVDQSQIRVRHHPVPWPGGRRWARDEIAQLYVVEVVSGSGKGKDVKTYEYKVRARLTNGKEALFLNGLLDPPRAKAVERVLELYLQIVNEKMKGEF